MTKPKHMHTVRLSNGERRSVKLDDREEDLLARLVAHFSDPLPVSASSVFRLALRRLAEAELGIPKKSTK